MSPIHVKDVRALIMTALFGHFEFFPITRDQLTILLEGNTGNSAPIFARLRFAPTPFNEASLAYLRS